MTAQRRQSLIRIYGKQTEEDLRASYNIASRLGTKGAKEHQEIIEELLEGSL